VIDEKEVLKILKRYEGRMNPTAYFSLEADIVNIKPVEAITKADYENRLKADMVAMLEDLDLQIVVNITLLSIGRSTTEQSKVVAVIQTSLIQFVTNQRKRRTALMDPWEMFSEMVRQVVENENVVLDVIISNGHIGMTLSPIGEDLEEDE